MSFFDDYEDSSIYGHRSPSQPCCRRCDAPITWVHSGERWRAYEPGRSLALHTCSNAATADEFDDLGEKP